MCTWQGTGLCLDRNASHCCRCLKHLHVFKLESEAIEKYPSSGNWEAGVGEARLFTGH